MKEITKERCKELWEKEHNMYLNGDFSDTTNRYIYILIERMVETEIRDVLIYRKCKVLRSAEDLPFRTFGAISGGLMNIWSEVSNILSSDLQLVRVKMPNLTGMCIYIPAGKLSIVKQGLLAFEKLLCEASQQNF